MIKMLIIGGSVLIGRLVYSDLKTLVLVSNWKSKSEISVLSAWSRNSIEDAKEADFDPYARRYNYVISSQCKKQITLFEEWLNLPFWKKLFITRPDYKMNTIKRKAQIIARRVNPAGFT